MTIKIRMLDLRDDLDQVIPSMRDFVTRMDYHDFLPETDEELVEALTRLVILDVTDAFVAEHNNTIVGGIGMIYAPNMWNLKALTAEELFWWVAKDAPKTTALRMLRYVRELAKSKGCQFITFKSLTSSPASIDKAYKQMGLRPIETTYMGVVA